MNPLGSNVRRLRTGAGLTQPELAERAGIEQGYLSKLENGRAAPSGEVIDRLAAALGVPLSALIEPPPARRRRLIAGMSVIAVLVLGAAFWALQPAPVGEFKPPPDAQLNVALAYDAAPPGIEVRNLSTSGEPARALFVRGLASDERTLRAYLDVLERYGQVASLDMTPVPWWRFGGVEFFARVHLDGVVEGGRNAGPAELEIVLHDGTEREVQAREQLLRLLETYDLERWRFTDTVRIQTGVIPHSHPVLTVGPTHLDDDLQQLSTYVHEQIHWHEEAHRDATHRAIETLKRRYPEVPDSRSGGARDEYSTYLHLIVCWLEFDAMTRLVGEAQARETLAAKRYYPWIYGRVLEDTAAIGEIVGRHGLLIVH